MDGKHAVFCCNCDKNWVSLTLWLHWAWLVGGGGGQLLPPSLLPHSTIVIHMYLSEKKKSQVRRQLATYSLMSSLNSGDLSEPFTGFVFQCLSEAAHGDDKRNLMYGSVSLSVENKGKLNVDSSICAPLIGLVSYTYYTHFVSMYHIDFNNRLFFQIADAENEFANDSFSFNSLILIL